MQWAKASIHLILHKGVLRETTEVKRLYNSVLAFAEEYDEPTLKEEAVYAGINVVAILGKNNLQMEGFKLYKIVFAQAIESKNFSVIIDVLFFVSQLTIDLVEAGLTDEASEIYNLLKTQAILSKNGDLYHILAKTNLDLVKTGIRKDDVFTVNYTIFDTMKIAQESANANILVFVSEAMAAAVHYFSRKRGEGGIWWADLVYSELRATHQRGLDPVTGDWRSTAACNLVYRVAKSGNRQGALDLYDEVDELSNEPDRPLRIELKARALVGLTVAMREMGDEPGVQKYLGELQETTKNDKKLRRWLSAAREELKRRPPTPPPPA